jgi:hypothetical protein
MVGIESQEGQSLLCGALGRPCLQLGDDAGKNTARQARARQPSRHGTPAVTPQRTNRRALIQTPAVERFTAPCLSGVRAGATVKHGDCGCLRVFAGIRRRSPEYAQCLNAPRLGTVGAMSHATQNAPHRTRQAPALPMWAARARTCPAVAKPAQKCPERPDALPVLGPIRDNRAHAVRHNGYPRYVGRADTDGTRSVACPLRPPGALGSPHSLQFHGSSRLTAWCRASWRQARSVGHSAAGSLSPMQGHHETQNHQRQRATRSSASMLAGDQP